LNLVFNGVIDFMYKKALVIAATAFFSLSTFTLLQADNANLSTDMPLSVKVGVVNFKSCLEKSKLGKEEQARFDAIKKQMETAIEEKEKELNALAPKFTEEYIDTLTPEAEQELKQKFKNISQDLSQQQNQYYHLLNQTNYQIMQKLNDAIAVAAQVVAKDKKIDLIVNEEACFYYAESFDCSEAVVAEMDKLFVKEAAASKSKITTQEQQQK